jgi:hypothetical protein
MATAIAADNRAITAFEIQGRDFEWMGFPFGSWDRGIVDKGEVCMEVS